MRDGREMKRERLFCLFSFFFFFNFVFLLESPFCYVPTPLAPSRFDDIEGDENKERKLARDEEEDEAKEREKNG